jgi:plasmid stabilization system protein ParE
VPRRVRLSPEARADLSTIRRWQTQPGSGWATKRPRSSHPAGRHRPGGEAPRRYARGAMLGTRELGIEGHRVVYQVTPDTGDNATAGDVIVLRVFGPGQQR